MTLATYHELLRDAFEASQAVDAFDLRSDDAASVETWKGLIEKQYSEACALTKFCEDNGREIRGLLAPVNFW